MFARTVSLNLKPDSVGEFAKMIDKEIIPLLRKQRGFHDEIMFIASGGLEAIGISLWDAKEDAEDYEHNTYLKVVNALGKFLDGVPQVHTYAVSNSTFHKIAVPVTA